MRLIVLLLLVSGFPAAALEYAECWDGDCLARGWTVKPAETSGFTDYQCRSGDCAASGWITGGTLGLEIYTSCKPGGCFKEGWYEIHRWNQNLLLNVACKRGDCFTRGWTGYAPEGNSDTVCTKNDCRRHGWRTQGPGFRNETVTCLKEGCFRAGWIHSVQ